MFLTKIENCVHKNNVTLFNLQLKILRLIHFNFHFHLILRCLLTLAATLVNRWKEQDVKRCEYSAEHRLITLQLLYGK